MAWQDQSVRWGNIAALTIFSMEAGLVFLMTIYLQDGGIARGAQELGLTRVLAAINKAALQLRD